MYKKDLEDFPNSYVWKNGKIFKHNIDFPWLKKMQIFTYFIQIVMHAYTCIYWSIHKQINYTFSMISEKSSVVLLVDQVG
jgi:hypothetical protein